MRSIPAVLLCTGVCALFGACDEPESLAVDGGTDSGAKDALPAFSCWPDITPVPRGTVELGKGGTAFSPMPETLPLEYGFQGGFMVKVWTRMTGFLPGSDYLLDPANPFTRVRATFVDSDAALQHAGECAERRNYVPNSVGGYDYSQEIATVFNTCWGTDRLVGARIEITVELMDATGSYSSDTRTVTVTESLDPAFHNIPTSPDCGT